MNVRIERVAILLFIRGTSTSVSQELDIEVNESLFWWFPIGSNVFYVLSSLKSSYKWIRGYRWMSSWASDRDTRIVTPDTMTVIHSHTRVTLMRCQMFHVPMSVLWLVTLLMLAVYTILYSPSVSVLRTKIQDPPWTAAAEALEPECPWHRGPGSSAWPGPTATDNTPQTVQDTAPTLFPVLTLYQKDLRNFYSFVW